VVGLRCGVLILAVLCALAGAPSGHASEAFSDTNVSLISLAANGKGEALVTYRRVDGTLRRVLVWGAVNALPPTEGVPQVRFRFDYAGGWGKYRQLAGWKAFRNECRPYDGPQLVFLVAGCKAPDGTYWTLQAWQRGLPLLGFDSWLPQHSAWELHLSHWSGELPRLEVSQNWTYGGAWQALFGRLSYLGRPVHGFGATASGNPRDRYGRNVYIDTLNSAYGAGWKRESGILVHRPTGTFCHSFVPQRPFPGYPSQTERPAAHGERHRVTVMGPGATPIVQWEGSGLTGTDRGRDGEFDAVFDAIMTGDGVCARER
jgi:hypothetical protein